MANDSKSCLNCGSRTDCEIFNTLDDHMGQLKMGTTEQIIRILGHRCTKYGNVEVSLDKDISRKVNEF